MFDAGDVVVATVQTGEGAPTKTRLALVLYEDLYSVVVAGITFNPFTKGIPLTKRDGAPKDCLIKPNYIFTLDRDAISRPLFKLKGDKKKQVLGELLKLLSGLQE